jgi:mycofactocin glycosyltransferase
MRRMDYGSSEAKLNIKHPHYRRRMRLSLIDIVLLMLLSALVVSPIVGISLLVLFWGCTGIKAWNKVRRLHNMGLHAPVSLILSAFIRERVSSLYHLGLNVSRYYSVMFFLLCFIWPPAWIPTLLLISMPPLIDYRRLRPPQSQFMFCVIYELEMIAYQLGVWQGCIKYHNLLPIFPRLFRTLPTRVMQN